MVISKEKPNAVLSQREKRPETALANSSQRNVPVLHHSIKRRSDEIPQLFQNEALKKQFRDPVAKNNFPPNHKQKASKTIPIMIDNNLSEGGHNEADFFLPKTNSQYPVSTTSAAAKKFLFIPQVRNSQKLEPKKPGFINRSRKLKKQGVGLEAAMLQGVATKKIIPV
jgi:hypothetical protein